MKNDCLGEKSRQYAHYITNLLVSLVCSKFTWNMLFHEFVCFTYWHHVSKTCMIHFFKIENIGWKCFTLLICASYLFWTHDVYMQKKHTHTWNKTFAWFPLSIMGWEVCDAWIKESSSSLTKISLTK
jgi:hypothetical protein